MILKLSAKPSSCIALYLLLLHFSYTGAFQTSENNVSPYKKTAAMGENSEGLFFKSEVTAGSLDTTLHNDSAALLNKLSLVNVLQRRDLQDTDDIVTQEFNEGSGNDDHDDNFDDDDSDVDQEEENSNLYDDDPEVRKDELVKFVMKLEKDVQEEEESLPFAQVRELNKEQPYAELLHTENYTKYEGYYMDGHFPTGGRNQSSPDFAQYLPEDIADIPEDIVDDVAAGVEEYLKLSNNKDDGETESNSETRQFPIYLFQGQYTPEPRLNPFIEGAMRNMARELRQDVMDPVYFRVLPRGRVESRPKPTMKLIKRRKRETEAQPRFLDRFKKSFKRVVSPPKKRTGGKRRRLRNKQKKKPGMRKPNIRRKVVKNRRRKRPMNNRVKMNIRRKNKRKPNSKNNKKKNNNNNKKNKKKPKKNKRQKRKTNRNVGGGRVEGLSKIACDGDAEMQVFGNYTLIRSHMKLGPVELSMQFKTQRGLRRTGATMPAIKMHTVTRLNMDGSEMIDFLLDRPHPESIKVRGNLFPLAQRIARNIFARLFVPNSFLTSRLREKAALALLSRPKG